ncbi:MAG: hypothetical protein JRJ57_00020 [Deltaproteobacteria bacterium]|nr:hypothetical protein [Deltaproteobacteria bacterium]
MNKVNRPDRQVFFRLEPRLGTAMMGGQWKMQNKGDIIGLCDLSKDMKETNYIKGKYLERTKEMKADIG